MKRIVALVGVVLLILMIIAVPSGAAQAAPNLDRIVKEGETVDEDIAIFGGNLVIEEGGTVDGDVSIFGGTADLAGEILGSVFVLGGNVTLSGTVEQDLVIFGGNLNVDSAADVDGECVLVGGQVTGDGATSVGCTTVGEGRNLAIPNFVIPPFGPSAPTRPSVPSTPELPSVPSPPSRPEVPTAPRVTFFDRTFSTIGQVLGRSVLLGLLALVIAAVLPRHLGEVTAAVSRKPTATGAIGLLTAIAGPSLVILLLLISILLTIVCIGLLGYPIVLALAILLAAGILLGWVAVGTLIGEKLARLFRLSNQGLPVVATLGTVVLTLAAGFMGSWPFWLGGWLWTIVAFLLACAGLGAVALTRFGTRPYPLTADDNGKKTAEILATLPDRDRDATVSK